MSIDQLTKAHLKVTLKETHLGGVQKAFERYNKHNIKAGKNRTLLFLKSDARLLSDVFENFTNLIIQEHEIKTFYFVSSPGFTWQYGSNSNGNKLQNLKNPDLFVTIEKKTICVYGKMVDR